MKKRGFGQGKWNGVGGKVEPGETIVAAAMRECHEEIGVIPKEPRLVGHLDFYDQAEPDFHFSSYVYVSTAWQGEPIETDEMQPQWFKTDEIPYEQMWADDPFWLPYLLDDKQFSGTVTLNGDELVEQQIKVVDKLEVSRD